MPVAFSQDELASPGGALPDPVGRAAPGARPVLTPGPHGRGEPEGQDLSGDGTDTPVSGFHAMLRLPASAPPAGRPAPPGPRAVPPGPRANEDPDLLRPGQVLRLG